MRTLTAEIAAEPRAEHGEGPVWDAARGAIVWIDQYLGTVRAARPASGDRPAETLETIELGAAVGAVVPHADGGWLASVGDGVMRLLPDGGREHVATVLPDDGIARRMNDGKVDPLGRFWIGSMAWDKRPGAGSLYVLDDGRVTEVLGGVSISNGLVWDRTGRELLYIDTPTHEVRRFAVTGGRDGVRLVDEGVAVRIPDEQGAPDGMSIDDEGCVWVALWGGSAVQRYSPAGELLARVEVDAPQVSSCCFGGPDLTTLFITTSQEGYDAAESAAHAGAGRLFTVETGVSGPPPDAYRG